MLAAKSNWKTSSDKSFRFAIDYWSSSAFFNPVFQSPSGTRRSEKENSFRSSKTCCWCIRKSWCPKKKTKSSGSNFKANGPKSDISGTSSTAEARMMDLIVGSFDILVRRVCKSETRAEETRDHRSLSDVVQRNSIHQSRVFCVFAITVCALWRSQNSFKAMIARCTIIDDRCRALLSEWWYRKKKEQATRNVLLVHLYDRFSPLRSMNISETFSAPNGDDDSLARLLMITTRIGIARLPVSRQCFSTGPFISKKNSRDKWSPTSCGIYTSTKDQNFNVSMSTRLWIVGRGHSGGFFY